LLTVSDDVTDRSRSPAAVDW